MHANINKHIWKDQRKIKYTNEIRFQFHYHRYIHILNLRFQKFLVFEIMCIPVSGKKIGFACFISEKVFNAEKFINFAFINWIFWKLLPSGRKCVIFQEEGIFWSVVKLIKFIWVSIFLIIKSILVFQGNSCIVAICFIPYLRTLRIMYAVT